jgi:hypothetical protein
MHSVESKTRLAGMIALVLIAGLTQAAGAESDLTVVALPDTQKYSENLPLHPAGFPPVIDPQGTGHIFDAQTRWVVDQARQGGIDYLVHLGDIVEHGNDTIQWNRAKAAMNRLHPDPATQWQGLPYGTCMGNHDNHDPDDWPEVPQDISPDRYLEYFSPGHDYQPGRSYSEQSWWAGHSPSGLSNAQIIQADNGREVLFLNLAIDVPEAELSWADGLVKAHGDKPAVVSTHRYLYDFRLLQGRYGDGLIGTPGSYAQTGLADEQYAPNAVFPQQLWDRFVQVNPNILMVLSGHCHGQYHQVSLNRKGLPVVEVLTDYQDGPNGGNGFLRIMDFDFEAGEIHFETYSPVTGRDRSILANDFLETYMMVEHYGPGLWQRLPAEQKVYYQNVYGVTDFEGFKNIVLAADLPQFDLTEHEDWSALVAAVVAASPDLQALDPAAAADYVEDHYKWEGLWMAAFAPDPTDPTTALEGEGPRDGEFTIRLGDYRDAQGRVVTFDSYIPEPTSMSLLGLGALALLRRRKR